MNDRYHRVMILGMIADYVMDGPSALLPQSAKDGMGPWLESRLAIEWHMLGKDPSVAHSLFGLARMLTEAAEEEPFGPVIRKAVWTYRQDFPAAKEWVVREPSVSVDLFQMPPASRNELHRLTADVDRALEQFPFLHDDSSSSSDEAELDESEAGPPVPYTMTLNRAPAFGEVKVSCDTGLSPVFDKAVIDVRTFLESLCVPTNLATKRWSERWVIPPETYARLLSSLLVSEGEGS